MNNDLISRSEAIAAVERREPLLVGDKLVSTDSFKNFLRNRPAVDAEPVRHGKWSESRMPDKHRILYLTVAFCPECKTDMVVGQYDNYCPNCGTKMDLEEDTNG